MLACGFGIHSNIKLEVLEMIKKTGKTQQCIDSVHEIRKMCLANHQYLATMLNQISLL